MNDHRTQGNGRSTLRSDRGTTVVEFAITSLVFFMTLFGIVQFGLVLWKYNVVAFAAKEGARYAAVRGASSKTPATATSVQAYAISQAFGENVTVATTWNPTDKSAGGVVTVQVSETFTPFTSLVPSTVINLRSTAQLTVVQ